jgi:simple sugar transport system permease protein
MIYYVTSFIVSIMAASTPLLLAASGELITEKSGVLNLGVEGMMLIGAIAGFATAHATGNAYAGVAAAAVGGMLISLIFAVLTLSLLANQIATGLALTIFGHGFAALLGAGFVGIAAPTLGKIDVPGLDAIPVLGPVLFDQNILIYVSFAMIVGISWFLRKTHAGLILRAVGDSHDAAHAMGYSVIAIRYAATAFGGAMAGIAGLICRCIIRRSGRRIWRRGGGGSRWRWWCSRRGGRSGCWRGRICSAGLRIWRCICRGWGCRFRRR